MELQPRSPRARLARQTGLRSSDATGLLDYEGLYKKEAAKRGIEPLKRVLAGLEEEDTQEGTWKVVTIDLNQALGTVRAQDLDALVHTCFGNDGEDEDPVYRLVLDLSENEFDVNEAQILGAGIGKGVITSLNLSSNFKGNEAECIAALLPGQDNGGGCHHLAVLDVSNIDLSSASVHFGDFLQKCAPGLQTLIARGCQLGDNGVRNICDSLLRSTATQFHTVDLSDNEISFIGAQEIAELLSHVPLKDLTLAQNGVGDRGVEHISLAMTKYQSLCRLDITSNNISCLHGLREICACLLEKNCSLKELLMCNTTTSMDDRALEILGAALGECKSLETIDLRSNIDGTCTAEGMEFLGESLSSNSTIINIRLPSFPHLGSDPFEPIQRTLTLNARLSSLIGDRKSRSSSMNGKNQFGTPTSLSTRKELLSSDRRELSVPVVETSPGNNYDNSSDPISPRVKEALSRWRTASEKKGSREPARPVSPKVLEALSRWQDDAAQKAWESPGAIRAMSKWKSATTERGSPNSVLRDEQNLDSHEYMLQKRTISMATQEKIRELKASLKAVRTRSLRHHAEIESRVSGRLSELSTRVGVLHQIQQAQLHNQQDHQQLIVKPRPKGTSNQDLESRISRLEHRLKTSSEQCQALANISKNVSLQLDDMKRSLSTEERSELLSMASDRRLQTENDLSNLVHDSFDECRDSMNSFENNFVKDFEAKQQIWRTKLERKLGQLVARIDALENSVINMHDDNIFALEAILQHRQRGNSRRK